MAETLNSPPPNPNHDPQPSNSIIEHLNSLSLQLSSDDAIVADVDLRENIDNNINNYKKEKKQQQQQRRISGGGGGGGGGGSGSKFPIRDGVVDCSFYLRTGLCKFGINCKFNHPPLKISQGGKVKGKEESIDVGGSKVKENNGSFDKEGQTGCKYFDHAGGCKFGKACKYNHTKITSPPLELNFMGLPIRPGEKECPYYMRTGSCKYGANCRFNHPDPTSVGGSDALPIYNNGGSNLSSSVSKSIMPPWSPAASLNESPSYVPFMFPLQGVPSQPEWTAYQAPAYPTETNMNTAPTNVMNTQSLHVNVCASQQEQILADEFPERPGEPECNYFLKTGDCKYRSACRFHHPKTTTSKSPPPCTLSDLGLPIRPGGSVCGYYSRYGICKYGPACKYDHPIHYAHSAPIPVSSVTDENPRSSNSGMNQGPGIAGAESEVKI